MIAEKMPIILIKIYYGILNLAPYIIIGVFISELLKTLSWVNFFSKIPNTRPLLTILHAAIIGIFSPLCTYGSIPIVIALFKIGFPFHSLVVFLVASSMMNPQLFILTWGGISPEMALLCLAATLLFSLLFGIAILKISQKWIINPNINAATKHNKIGNKEFNWSTFLKNNWESLQFIGYYIVVGVVLGTLIEVFVPAKWFLVVFESRVWLGVLLGALLGVPLYACGGGAIPLINSMLNAGMSSGAALAFLIVGPATRITPLLALAAVIRPKFLVIYIAALILFAVVLGSFYAVF